MAEPLPEARILTFRCSCGNISPVFPGQPFKWCNHCDKGCEFKDCDSCKRQERSTRPEPPTTKPKE